MESKNRPGPIGREDFRATVARLLRTAAVATGDQRAEEWVAEMVGADTLQSEPKPRRSQK